MADLGYVFRRIARMDFGRMFKVIDKCHNKCGRNKVSLFFDCVFTGLIYGAGYMDFYQFRMYDMNAKEKKTVITRGVNNSIVRKYNDKKSIYKFDDKIKFNEIFNDYMNREWMEVKEDNADDFAAFCGRHAEIIVKPVSQSCGVGVEKILTTGEDLKALHQRLFKNGQILVEEVAGQHDAINAIYPLSVNTLRIVTLKNQVATALFRIGNGGNVVDNFNHGGMVTRIDVDDGIVKWPAIDKDTNVYEVHPYTGYKLIGTKIPMWEEAKAMCVEASKVVPEVGYIAWDVCVGKDRPCLIEGNNYPGYDLYQLPVHREGNMGLYPHFKEIMGDD
ncbi:Sugar-transfer associated ATP-grasp [Ruminococcaceae bacterium YRB3002]|nr:Sugar-transfer associated ATP-grasp [Ruminococcaceae bacterium YRB3002]